MKLRIILILVLIFNLSYSQLSTDKNYVHIKTYKNAVSETSTSSDINDVNEVVSYIDGKGRSSQKILIKSGGNYEDIILNNEYDNLNRESKKYLAYSRSSSVNGTYESNFYSNQASFYNTTKYENTLNPYTEIKFDNEKISNPAEIAHPGNDWNINNGHTLKNEWFLYLKEGLPLSKFVNVHFE